MRLIFSLFPVLWLSLTSFSVGSDQLELRDSVAQALPSIQERGQWWIEEKKCNSCHRTSFQTWSLQAAADKGFAVDLGKLTETRNWSRTTLLEPAKEGAAPRGTTNREGVAQVVWSDRKRFDSETSREQRKTFLEFLRAGQQPDGTWKAGGQLPFQKRPKPETNMVSTMWNALALGTVVDQESQAARANAMHAIAAAKPGESTEWSAVRLLLAVQSKSQPAQQQWIEELLSRQHEDGSWSWSGNDESDPIGTGMAIYALRHAGVPASDPVLQKAARFLLETQGKDGVWKTAGTKTKAQGKPVETSNYWGTCWAVIGLTSLLP